jgi:hypothetical protein
MIYVIERQLMVWMIFTRKANASALVHLVFVVVIDRSQEQMIRTHTPRIVAFMKDALAIRNCPKGQNPRSTMSSNLFHSIFFAQSNLAILKFFANNGSNPNPTSIRLCDLHPESFFKG